MMSSERAIAILSILCRNFIPEINSRIRLIWSYVRCVMVSCCVVPLHSDNLTVPSPAMFVRMETGS